MLSPSEAAFFVPASPPALTLMPNRCPQCGKLIPVESINIGEGVALCEACGELSRLAEVVEDRPPVNQLLESPPTGCQVIADGSQVRLRATLRSLPGFLFTVAFGLFWNSIVSVFVLAALAGMYTHLIGPPPAWFPAMDADATATLGESIFLCLFLIPFLLVGGAMAGAALLYATGQVEVVIEDDRAWLSRGIGFLRWHRRFDPRRVQRVQIEVGSGTNGHPTPEIVLETNDRTLKFGGMLRAVRTRWLAGVLRELLVKRSDKDRASLVRQFGQAEVAPRPVIYNNK